jgi:hypothetical protein
MDIRERTKGAVKRAGRLGSCQGSRAADRHEPDISDQELPSGGGGPELRCRCFQR